MSDTVNNPNISQKLDNDGDGMAPETISSSVLDSSKKNEGYPKNETDPYNVDMEILKLYLHKPEVIMNKDQIGDTIPELQNAILYLSRTTEKRLVQIENILATNLLHVHRLSSRININCQYYGGQSVFDKYLCIRCLHNDMINDTSVSLDQCLNCQRYEPVIGQIYDIPVDEIQEKNIHTAIEIDRSQAARTNKRDIVNAYFPNSYNTVTKATPSVIKNFDETHNIKVVVDETAQDEQIGKDTSINDNKINPKSNKFGIEFGKNFGSIFSKFNIDDKEKDTFTMDWSEVPMSEQNPNIAKYEYKTDNTKE